MSKVVNSRDIIKQLSKNGLQIGNKATLNYYIRNFNYNTFIHGYSDPFYIDSKNRRYDPEANSDELINLYTFDRDMANHILRFILVIEKIINTNVVYEIINQYNIRDKCLLKFENKYIQDRILPNLKNVEPKISYDNFIRKLIKYLPTSSMTRIYVQKNIHDDVIR
jgi:abortive infection bacteriophage resistance protein